MRAVDARPANGTRLYGLSQLRGRTFSPESSSSLEPDSHAHRGFNLDRNGTGHRGPPVGWKAAYDLLGARLTRRACGLRDRPALPRTAAPTADARSILW